MSLIIAQKQQMCLSKILEPPEARLVNGSSFCSGRVEVLHNQQWRTVRSVSWNLRDAQVVCREVGCGPALSAEKGPHFGRGHGPFLWKDTFCFGTEAALRYCQKIDMLHKAIFEDYFEDYWKDVGTVCSGNGCECIKGCHTVDIEIGLNQSVSFVGSILVLVVVRREKRYSPQCIFPFSHIPLSFRAYV